MGRRELSALGDGTNANNNGAHLVDESQYYATVRALAVNGSIYVSGNFDLVKTGAARWKSGRARDYCKPPPPHT